MKSDLSMAEVRLQLVAEEARESTLQGSRDLTEGSPPSEFIAAGLALERTM